MEDIDAFRASHFGRVKVDFCLSARDLDPEAVSQVTGLQPDRTAKRGDERRNYKGDLLTPHDEGFWLISSAKRVQSKDVNVHLKSLLTELLPHQRVILQIVAELKGETFFDVLWTSNYLYAGTGPLLSQEVVRGISDLGAAVGFDIYAVESGS